MRRLIDSQLPCVYCPKPLDALEVPSSSFSGYLATDGPRAFLPTRKMPFVIHLVPLLLALPDRWTLWPATATSPEMSTLYFLHDTTATDQTYASTGGLKTLGPSLTEMRLMERSGCHCLAVVRFFDHQLVEEMWKIPG